MAYTKALTHVYPERKLYVALELANKAWKMAMSDSPGRKARIVTIPPFSAEFSHALEKARVRFDLPEGCAVMVVMEAGRDGFSVYRWLESLGIASIVIDPASVDVNRRKRRAKTDRLDALALVARLIRHDWGEQKVWQVCRVPAEEAEDRRHRTREREALVSERTRHTNRIKGLLATQGVRAKVDRNFAQQLDKLRDPRGKPLPPGLRARVRREFQRLKLVNEQIRELEAQMKELATREPTPEEKTEAKIWGLAQLRGVGATTANTLVNELFGWREFNNRREVGGATGLVGTPYDTGDAEREQGISKAANARVRRIAIELAWSWVRFQPDSELTLWFEETFRGAKRRVRVGIVALARRLMIALWHFVEHGVIPEGATFKNRSPLAA